jgi:RHS repeat-associated protein
MSYKPIHCFALRQIVRKFNLLMGASNLKLKQPGGLVLVVLLTAFTIFGQSGTPSVNWNLYDAGTPSGRSATSTQMPAAFSGRENAASATVNISEVLASLPGRSLNTTVSLNYNTPQHQHQYPFNQVYRNIYPSDLTGWVGAGFEVGYGKLLFHQIASYEFDGPVMSTLFEPDGTAHRMMQDYSVDGSDIKLVQPWGAPFSPTPVATYPNGTVVRFGARNDSLGGLSGDAFFFPIKITDRNGNYIEIFYENNQGPRITKVVDTLGREIIYNRSGGKLTSISVPGQAPSTQVEVARFYHENGTYIYSFNNQSHTLPANYLRYVYLPSTKSGWHYYYSTYGMIYRVEKLQGMDVDAAGNITNFGQVVASTEYNYPLTPSNLSTAPRYTQRTDDWSGNTGGPVVYTFSYSYDLPNRLIIDTTMAPDGTSTENQRRFYSWDDPVRFSTDINPMAMWDEGLVVKSKTTKGAKSYVVNNQWEETEGGGRLKETISTNEIGQQKKVVYEYQPETIVPTGAFSQNYGPCNNITEVKEYEFDGSLKKRIATTYETGTAWTNRGLLRLPTQVKIFAGTSTTPVAQVGYAYDAGPALVSYGSLSMLDTSTPSQRGNLTSISRNSNAANPSQGVTVTETFAYDVVGNTVSRTDANGNTSQTEYSADYNRAYPTRAISAVPIPGAAALIIETAFNFNTGLVMSNKDANNQITSYTYDVGGRVTRIDQPDGGWTTYDYSDAPGELYVKARSALDGSRYTESFQRFNGRGWPVRSQLREGTTWIVKDTQYDVMGRVWRVSNPFRSTDANGGPVNPSNLWTTRLYDELGRTTSVTTPDNAQILTEYEGNATTVTDEAGNARRTLVDALGNLVKVIEDPNRTGYTGLNWETNYTHDVSGNLRKVEQGGQLRFFMYDSLNRLIRARNTEQGTNASLDLDDPLTSNEHWSSGYQYDANGNLTRKTDARGVFVDYAYDALNRGMTTDYSDTTINPDVSRFYDGATNGKGRFWYSYAGGTSVSNILEQTAVDSYDALGRPRVQRQLFTFNGAWAPAYTIEREYNLAGDPIALTYPSGRTVNYTYDDAGRVSSFTGNLGGASKTYASNITYHEFGGIQQQQFGTQTTLYHKLHYNVRGQMYDVRLSSVPWATDQWNWNRGAVVLYFGYPHQQSGPLNNGNVSMMQHYVPADDQLTIFNFTEQRYTYDKLNRLTSVAEYPGTQTGLGANSMTQIFDYDRWGNRTISSATTNAPEPQFTASSATNRLEVPVGQTGRMDYDLAGNLVNDTYTSFGRADGTPTRLYDADNHLTTAKDANLQVVSSYAYNAAGQRTRRKIGSAETWQIFGMDGELLAEYAANAADTQPQKEYGYRNGALLVTATVDPGWGPAPSYSGPNPLVAQSEIKLENLTELRTAVNQLRQHAGLPAFNFTVDPNPERFVTTAKADHIRQLRTALEGARLQLGLSTGGYAHPTLTENSSWIFAIDYQELRDQVHSAWNSGGGTDIRWLVSDHLGTARMTVNQTGSLASVKRHDYLPFGEEIGFTVGGRSGSQGYGTDPLRQRFTAKERDNEIGLDYFLARYYSSTQGRFTSIDPENHQAKRDLTDPQSWNAYSYVNNNPLVRTDSSGKAFDWLRRIIQRFHNRARYGYFETDAEIQQRVANDRAFLLEQEKQAKGNLYYRSSLDEPWRRLDINNLTDGQVLFYARSFRSSAINELTQDQEMTALDLPPIAGASFPPVPKTPPNTTVGQFGKDIMKWGTGDAEARARAVNLTREELQRSGVTREMAEAWRDFYREVVKQTPGNPSAAGRADLMQKALELLGGK